MKRTLAILLAAALLFCTLACLPFSVSADWLNKEEDFLYEIVNNEATVTGYVGTGGSHGSVTIPDTLGGVPVTAVGDGAFDSVKCIYGLILPDSLRTVGKAAFRNCIFLQGVIFPESLTAIGDEAFMDCAWLKSITLPAAVTHIGNDAFRNCGQVESITVAERNAVYCSKENCLIETGTGTLLKGSINSVIPDGVKAIGRGAFAYCTQLNSIAIPTSVTSIGDEAFLFNGLKALVIPKTVTSIGREAFCSCSFLESITVEKGNTVYRSEGNCLIETKTGILLQGCINSVIPNGVKAIADRAFAYIYDLSSAIIPDGVTEIGAKAFLSCYHLPGAIIPDSVTKIGEGAFFCCDSMRSIYIPKSVTEMGETVFYGQGLESVSCGADAKPEGWADTWLGNYSAHLTIHWGAKRPLTSSGDLDGSGEIDASDYMMLKRFCLGSLPLNDEQKAVADVNQDGELDSIDYMILKRIVLGTYPAK